MVSPSQSAARTSRTCAPKLRILACLALAFASLAASELVHRRASAVSLAEAPQILFEEFGPESNQAAAVDSTLALRDPFHVRLQYSWWAPAPDQNTRVSIFVSNVPAGIPVTINLIDARGQPFNVSAENVREIAGSEYRQVTFRLPDNIAPGACTVNVVANGLTSNTASFRIAFEAEHWREDLQVLAAQLLLLHVNPFTRISRQQFDQAVADLDKDIAGLQDHEIVTRMMQLAALIGDAHTSLSIDGSRLRFRTFPIKTYWFTDGLFVTSVATANSQALGKRVTNIGGTDISAANAEVTTTISHENDMWVRAQAPARFSSPEILAALRVSPEVQSGAFMVQDPTGGPLPVNINSVFATQTVNWLSLPDPAQTPTPLYRQHPELNYWFDYVAASHTLYLQYNVCLNRQDLPFNQFLQQMQQFAASHQVDKLVIDLRNNTGGDSSILQPLINAVATDSNLNRSDRLFVIIGRLTISSGLLNAISLRQQTQATFVGEATGGKPNHFGEVGSFRLTNSRLLVTYSKKFFTTVSGDPASLFPDITIELSSTDYFSGRDPVMEYILNH